MNKKIEPPSDMSRVEKTAFRRLLKALDEHGVDPKHRLDLVDDYVRLQGRIAALRKQDSMPATRALNVAIAERRRLHAAVFAGAREQRLPTPEEQTARAAQAEADSAWRAFFSGDRTRSEAELEVRYGEPSWSALIYRTDAEAEHAVLKLASGD